MEPLVQEDMAFLTKLGDVWMDAISRRSSEVVSISALKDFSWKLAFFTITDTLVILPQVAKHLGMEEADYYKLDWNAIKVQIQLMDEVKPGDCRAYDIFSEVFKLVATSTWRQTMLWKLGSIPSQELPQQFRWLNVAQAWAGELLRGSRGYIYMKAWNYYSWKVAFFSVADKLVILPQVEKQIGKEAAKTYKLGYDAIKRHIQNMENMKSQESLVQQAIHELFKLVKMSDARKAILYHLESILAEDKHKLIETYRHTVKAFKKKVLRRDKTPLDSAAELLDAQEEKQREILDIQC
ncbi:hypothetical protein DL93DRAFT_2170973 [Clavulina sp. PMI_390]|nr:hypothetical protein DL93DRAFT_2170973 [Clavulina sp. PMI_390]